MGARLEPEPSPLLFAPFTLRGVTFPNRCLPGMESGWKVEKKSGRNVG